ncbi:hypothetical protein CCACVL1_01738 [Corchorus capsularis]|uniref:Uncharacterized protein n=1 Tax=Corchorus capsularis TaxID=210143 RepID=A0A1R3KG25_COCAP|nr:hypothetical protein CCACVL1_01738 [Corchorus capsularis]
MAPQEANIQGSEGHTPTPHYWHYSLVNVV